MEEICNKKRNRDELTELPESKRRLIFEFLDDEDDEVDSGVDLTDVMRTLEEEITAPPPEIPPPLQLDLGYLLEASDDELGLPPAVGSTESTSDGGVGAEVVEEEVAGFERIWDFEDEILIPYQTEFDDGGLFGCYDGATEYEEFSWRGDTLTAV